MAKCGGENGEESNGVKCRRKYRERKLKAISLSAASVMAAANNENESIYRKRRNQRNGVKTAYQYRKRKRRRNIVSKA
jgi:hypothetical protein